LQQQQQQLRIPSCFSFFMGMGGVGFSPSNAMAVWEFGFLVWAVFALLFECRKKDYIAQLAWTLWWKVWVRVWVIC
jgi:hypothetical protein